MNLEKHASFVYKQMVCSKIESRQLYFSLLFQAAYFDHVKVAKRGFAKLFHAQAKEEHEHFEKFLDYINLRSAYVANFNVKVCSI